ncbi:MAG: DNA-deoxyinosine glycosylase [Candidatus Omnitrophica bacterium]|nr:DNA-deoxyinosine glycosylase [Candidatus Omnitrophota bacterium]
MPVKSKNAVCLDPVFKRDAKVLILGSMPGGESLRMKQYYAHPRNHFWNFMEQIAGIDSKLSYTRRITLVKSRQIALWDVMQTCVREGSLDSQIRNVIPNDIESFTEQLPGLRKIILNGRAAETEYRKHFGSHLSVPAVYLPSTSPANAGLSYRKKISSWQAVFKEFTFSV